MPQRRLLPVLAAILLALLSFPRPAAADPADIAAASRGVARVVLVASDGESVSFVGHGSGFAVTPTLIVTNAHVVAPLREDDTMIVGVVPSEGSIGYAAELVAYSPGNDLALLRLTDRGTLPPLALFAGQANDAGEVHAVGYPGNVDLAQGLSLAEIIEPQAAVRTRGYLSSGRSSRQFESLLHTAPIGSGNSGGPLLDGCGRVIGVNSFGTVSQGADSEFYFAVATSELLRFLRQAGVNPRITAQPCRSIADLDRQEMERTASERARLAAEAQREASAAERDRATATRRAELAVIAERENGMALALLLLVLASAAGGTAGLFELRSRRREALIAGALGGALLLGALIAWISRPPLDSVEERVAADATPDERPAPRPARQEGSGALVCIFDAQRSRATVSDAADVALDWREDGCVNGRSQYAPDGERWSRILVPNEEATVSINSYEPQSRTYRVERFMLDLQSMNEVRQARSGTSAPSCGSGAEAARRFGEEQQAIRALLPPTPNERLFYRCQER